MAGSKSDQQEIIQTFQQLRNEQRSLIAKISELEQDSNEHKVVIETLQDVNPDRKCFRMIGGILVEKTVKEILPTLTHNRTQLTKLIESLNEKLVAKGKELNEFREKHGIKIRGQEELANQSEKSSDSDKKEASTGVLVSSKS